MFLINFLRLFKYSFQGFFRNFWLSFVCITTITLAFLLINSLGSISAVSKSIVDSIKNKVDISVYMIPQVTDAQASQVIDDLKMAKGVNDVIYISKDQALENFKKKHSKNEVLVNSLNDLDTNPIGATLVIKSSSIDSYSGIIDYLTTFPYKDLIENTDYTDNKTIINRINGFNASVSSAVFFVSLFFGFISAITVLNTLRITIYSRKREIEIMRFLGASWSFVKIPFIIESMFYLLFGWLLSIIIFFVVLNFLNPYGNILFSFYNENLVNVISSNIWGIVFKELFAGIIITAVTSIFTIRKYAKV